MTLDTLAKTETYKKRIDLREAFKKKNKLCGNFPNLVYLGVENI